MPQIIDQQLSVRDTERLAKSLVNPEATKPQPRVEVKANGAELDPNVRAALDEIAMALGNKSTVCMPRLQVRSIGDRILLAGRSRQDLRGDYKTVRIGAGGRS